MADPEWTLSLERAELEALAAGLIARAFGESDRIELAADYYWSVPTASAYDVEAAPPELGIGQLSEDLTFLRSNGSDPDAAAGYGLVWLGEIFKAIGRARPQ